MLELFFRAFETEAAELEAQDFICFIEEVAGALELVVQILAHADRLGALAGKHECPVGVDRVRELDEGGQVRGRG